MNSKYADPHLHPHLQTAHLAIETELASIEKMQSHLGEGFIQAVDLIIKAHQNKGNIITLGVGKSAIIAQKLSASLASVGFSSFFIHANDAGHGSLGAVKSKDVVLVFSHSGRSREVLNLVNFFKTQKASIIAFCGVSSSHLAQQSDCLLLTTITQEVALEGIIPTSSTTCALVMADALCATLIKAIDLKASDFAKFHPEGNLGYQLNTTVADVMQSKDLPVVLADDGVDKVVEVMTAKNLGCVVVLGKGEAILGVVTNGDLSRFLNQNKHDLFTLKAHQLASKNPKFIEPSATLAQAKKKMNDSNITILLVPNSSYQLQGIIQLFSCDI